MKTLTKTLNNMNMFHALRIKEHYPNNLMAITEYSEKHLGFTAGLFIKEDGNKMIGELLYQLDSYSYPTELKAIEALKNEVEMQMDMVLIMSN